jgi:hypothetical protein
MGHSRWTTFHLQRHTVPCTYIPTAATGLKNRLAATSARWRMRESQIKVKVAHTRSILVKENFRNKFDSMNTCSKVVVTPVPIPIEGRKHLGMLRSTAPFFGKRNSDWSLLVKARSLRGRRILGATSCAALPCELCPLPRYA